MQSLPERPPQNPALDAAGFAALVAAHQPVVLRGSFTHWPAVQAAAQGLEAALRFWAEQATDAPVDALLARPEDGRQFGFAEPGGRLNFLHSQRPLTALLEALWRYAQFPEPPALALQSADVRRCLRDFEARHPMPLLQALAPAALPRLWLGNRATVPAHFDTSYNLAVVVAGRRRFTLFPPAQLENLYLGPLEQAPAQAPLSCVNVQAPDFERFPKARLALDAAFSAELQPGDAIFMPPLWLHSVESLDAFNGLLNYWWRPEVAPGAGADNPAAALWLAMLSFRSLPAAERRDWQRLFAQLVFEEGDWGHIPEAQRGVLGALDADTLRSLRQRINRLLSRCSELTDF